MLRLLEVQSAEWAVRLAAVDVTDSAGPARVAAGAMDTVAAVVPGVEAEAAPVVEVVPDAEVEVVMACV